MRPKRAAKRAPEERPRRPSLAASKEPPCYEVEVLDGLEPFVLEELSALPGVRVVGGDKTSVQFYFEGTPAPLRKLRTALAVYRLESFPVPRPKALLGHEHMTRLLRTISEVREQDTFSSFRFSAAGRDSAVFTRLAEATEKGTGLSYDANEGDLLLRMRPSQRGWEVLFRTTARPLSSRAWRVCNLAGGLNATLAAAVIELVGVRPNDRFFNAMCGSGTLLIERGLRARAARLVGCDVNGEALACADENVRAGHLSDVELAQTDATASPFEDASFDVIVADVPWGDAVGTHEGNAALYPAFLEEAARLAASGARLAVLTHEIRLFERVLSEFKKVWQLRETVRVFHGGHYPRAYVFVRL